MTTAENTTRTNELAAAIRGKIVCGTYAPGDRLPSFHELSTNYSVSRGLAQLAVEKLKREGFIRSSDRRGLFVTSNPPHLRRYGLVFPMQPVDSTWSRFNQAMVHQSHLVEQASAERQFEIFAGTNHHRYGQQVVQQMRDEISLDRLAGLIFTPKTFDLAHEMPFANPAFPKVYIFQNTLLDDRPIITGTGTNDIVDRTVKQLAERGCTRIATIRVEGTFAQLAASSFEKFGLTYYPHWMQAVGRGDHTVLQTLVPLLLHGPADQRPDGLIVLDDNMIDFVLAAISQTGLQIGTDLHVIARCNWPISTPTAVPITRIGPSVGQMLKLAIEAIDMQRCGQTPPPIQTVPDLFEDELD